MPDITKEFIREIPIEKDLMNVLNRKIVKWGKVKKWNIYI